MQPAIAWQHVLLHNQPACSCVERKDGRDYARVTCPNCNGAGVARETGERLRVCGPLRELDERVMREFRDKHVAFEVAALGKASVQALGDASDLARELERMRCLDAIIHAWNDLAGRCLAEGRPMRSADLPAFRDDIRARIVADERPITRAQLRELAAKTVDGKAAT